MSSASRLSVAYAVVYRYARIQISNPSLFVPYLLFPLMSFMAYAGGLSRLRSIPGFHYTGGYTSFQFVFVLLQSAAFGGVFTGFSVARDFEYGFARRLLIAAPRRSGLVLGYVGAALLRWTIVATVVTAVGLAARMHIGGNGIEIVGLYTLGAIVNIAFTLWAAGVALRTRSIQSGPLMQTPVFLLLFLAPVYVPLSLLSGWIHGVASVNPFTAFVEAGRGLISGDRYNTGAAFGIAFVMGAGLILWAILGLRRAERTTS